MNYKTKGTNHFGQKRSQDASKSTYGRTESDDGAPARCREELGSVTKERCHHARYEKLARQGERRAPYRLILTKVTTQFTCTCTFSFIFTSLLLQFI